MKQNVTTLAHDSNITTCCRSNITEYHSNIGSNIVIHKESFRSDVTYNKSLPRRVFPHNQLHPNWVTQQNMLQKSLNTNLKNWLWTNVQTKNNASITRLYGWWLHDIQAGKKYGLFWQPWNQQRAHHQIQETQLSRTIFHSMLSMCTSISQCYSTRRVAPRIPRMHGIFPTLHTIWHPQWGDPLELSGLYVA